MSALQIIGLVILWLCLCVIVLMIFKGSRGPEDEGRATANERIDSIRQSLDGDRTELRASDFAALEPRTHVRAGTKSD